MSKDGILVLNCGSSSLKFAIYADVGDSPALRLGGQIDRIGFTGTKLAFKNEADGQRGDMVLPQGDARTAAQVLLDWLASLRGDPLSWLTAVGHRVVHGMAHSEPEPVTSELLDELRRIAPLDPDHLPTEILLIEMFRQRLPRLPHIVCFDTSFHAGMPRVAQQLTIPRRYEAQGLRRYGFHGLSYAYLSEELARLESRVEARRRVVLAHLGSGASMAAVLDGRSVDTSMAFSPNSGLPMSTRSGDLDPGIAAYLERTGTISPSSFFAMASHESGLLGISETSSDMRDLLEREATDVRAAEAVSLFCYQAKKCIGAYAAALGGLDTLVFAGGIGESAAVVRARICEGLGFLGIEIDADRNADNHDLISSDAGRTAVRVIRTDEALMIARSVRRALRRSSPRTGHFDAPV